MFVFCLVLVYPPPPYGYGRARHQCTFMRTPSLCLSGGSHKEEKMHVRARLPIYLHRIRIWCVFSPSCSLFPCGMLTPHSGPVPFRTLLPLLVEEICWPPGTGGAGGSTWYPGPIWNPVVSHAYLQQLLLYIYTSVLSLRANLNSLARNTCNFSVALSGRRES